MTAKKKDEGRCILDKLAPRGGKCQADHPAFEKCPKDVNNCANWDVTGEVPQHNPTAPKKEEKKPE